jgi:hypothetical protein
LYVRKQHGVGSLLASVVGFRGLRGAEVHGGLRLRFRAGYRRGENDGGKHQVAFAHVSSRPRRARGLGKA